MVQGFRREIHGIISDTQSKSVQLPPVAKLNPCISANVLLRWHIGLVKHWSTQNTLGLWIFIVASRFTQRSLLQYDKGMFQKLQYMTYGCCLIDSFSFVVCVWVGLSTVLLTGHPHLSLPTHHAGDMVWRTEVTSPVKTSGHQELWLIGMPLDTLNLWCDKDS